MQVTLRTAVGGAVIAALSSSPSATAQPVEAPALPAAASPSISLPSLDVEGRTPPPRLAQPTAVGSYLGLKPVETPASIDVITQEQMQQRGLRDLIEVYNASPGVRAGNLPGEPGVTTIRGLSRAATGYSLDGARSIDPLLISRNFDSFAFERVEVLRGPASIVNGTGALAGAINLVTRRPVLGENFNEGLLSYGSFNTLRGGAGFNRAIGSNAAIRSSLSYSQSDGYVDDTDSRKLSFTTGFTIRPTDRLTLDTSFAYFHDAFGTPYQGSPLVPRAVARDPSGIISAPGDLVLDRATRSRNYNVSNGMMRSDTYLLRANATYALNADWKLTNEFSYFSADRFWANSEDYTYNRASGLLDRSTSKITHDQQFWSDRLAASFDGQVGGLRNRFSAGYEYYQTGLSSIRRFGTTSAVDPFSPVRGAFPTDTAANFDTRQNFDSTVRSNAIFAENAVNLTPDWLLLGGLRYENIGLQRQVDNVTTSATTNFNRNFDSTSWRIGTVYNLMPGVALFGQYTRGVVPVTALLLSNQANARFDLSSGEAVEVGVKSSFWGDRAVVTTSLYQIEQNNILTRDPNRPSLTVQGGSQRSRGIELDISVAVTDRWTLGLNGALQAVEFTELRDSAGNDLSGKRPPNVPTRLMNALTSYRLRDLPLTIGASVRHVGASFTDNANTIRMADYTLLDAFAAYDVGPGTLALRGRNLTNAFYADWSGYSAQQVYVGPPLSVDLSYSMRF